MDTPTPSCMFCTLYSNTQKLGTLSSTEYTDPHNSLLVPYQGVLKIKIGSNSCLLGSVSFPVTLINDNGCLWLPILPSGSTDYIETLPEELSSPKVLLYFEKKSEETEDFCDELKETKEKLTKLTQNFQEFVKNAKKREIKLIQELEEKEQETQSYVLQLSKAQNRIFSLLTEKKNLSEMVERLKDVLDSSKVNELKQELENTRQELFSSEARCEKVLKTLEDVESEWNYIQEESRHYKESELLSQILSLRHDLELKTQEISLLKSSNFNIFQDIPLNLPHKSELTDTIKHTVPCKPSQNVSCINESLKTSFNLEEELNLNNSLFTSSRAVSPIPKENSRQTPDLEKSKSSYKISTVSSNNKAKFVPLSILKRYNKSTERRK